MTRHLRVSVTLAALLALPGAPALAGEPGPGAAERGPAKIECRSGTARAETNIGTIPEGSSVQGGVRRHVRTGSRVTIADGGRRVVCTSGDERAVKEVLDELRGELPLEGLF